MLRLFSHRRPQLALIGAAASWGLGAVISKRALAELSPVVLLPIQLAVSVSFLGLARGNKSQTHPRQLAQLRLLGVLNPGASYFLSLLGLTLVSVSVSILLWALEPLLILGMSAWLLREPITKRTGILSAVALGGAALVVLEPGGNARLLGVILTLAGVACCAVYTVLAKRILIGGYESSNLSFVRIQQVAALAFSLVLLVVLAPLPGLDSVADVSPMAWASAVLSGVFYYSVAFWLYVSGLRFLDASAAGLYLNLIPVFGIIAGQIVLNEDLTRRQWWGAAIIVASVIMISLRSGSARSSSEP